MPDRFEKPHDWKQSPRPVLLASLGNVIDAYATGQFPGIVADLEQARRDLAARPVVLSEQRERVG